MRHVLIFSYTVMVFAIFANAGPLELHSHPELAIVGYTGPIDKNIMQLLRGAEILEVRNSELTKMDGHSISVLPKLRVIKFINCTVDAADVDLEYLFHGAENLKEFHASHIKAPELRPDALRKTSIEVFILTDNNYPTVPGHMWNETKLKKLVLSRNHIETLHDDVFFGLDKLEILDLETNKLKTISPNIFKPLKNLKVLNLKENSLEKFGTNDLPELTHLEVIDLGYNPLKELSLDKIESVAPKLTKIDITGSRLSEAEIKLLQEKTPKIHIKTSKK